MLRRYIWFFVGMILACAPWAAKAADESSKAAIQFSSLYPMHWIVNGNELPKTNQTPPVLSASDGVYDVLATPMPADKPKAHQCLLSPVRFQFKVDNGKLLPTASAGEWKNLEVIAWPNRFYQVTLRQPCEPADKGEVLDTIQEDLDHDGNLEILQFYRRQDGLKQLVLRASDTHETIFQDVVHGDRQKDRVWFADLNRDGHKEIGLTGMIGERHHFLQIYGYQDKQAKWLPLIKLIGTEAFRLVTEAGALDQPSDIVMKRDLFDTVGHIEERIYRWDAKKFAYTLKQKTIAWSNGGPKWPATPEQTAAAFLEALKAGQTAEAGTYLSRKYASLTTVGQIKTQIGEIAATVPAEAFFPLGSINPNWIPYAVINTEEPIRKAAVYLFDIIPENNLHGAYKINNIVRLP